MKKAWTVVTPGNDAGQNVSATRNTNAERGVGRGYRQETDMTPVIKARTAVLSGNPTWGQSKSWREGGNLIGKTGKSTVTVRAANADPGGIGLSTAAWGVAGLGDDPAPVASPGSLNAQMITGVPNWVLVVATVGALWKLGVYDKIAKAIAGE